MVTQDEPAVQNSPPPQDTASPARAPSPVIQERENPAEEQPEEPPVSPAQDDVVVTGEQQTTPEASTALAKIPAKPEPASKDKGKTVLNFSTFEDQDASTLHQAVLTRLSESRDTEIAMITSLKQKYEVICILLFCTIYICSPQGPGHYEMMTRDFQIVSCMYNFT